MLKSLGGFYFPKNSKKSPNKSGRFLKNFSSDWIIDVDPIQIA